MNTKSFTETGSTFTNRRFPAHGLLGSKDGDRARIESEITSEHAGECFVNTEYLKSVLPSFEISRSNVKNDISNWEAGFLIDYIIKIHHDFAKKNAVTIYNLAQKVRYRHGDFHPELLTLTKIIFLFFHDLLNQMKEEEQYLFPYIRQIACNIKCGEINSNGLSKSVKTKIELVQNEQAKALAYLEAIRQVTDNFVVPPDACVSYRELFKKLRALEDDLNVHFYLEDILFPNDLFITESDRNLK